MNKKEIYMTPDCSVEFYKSVDILTASGREGLEAGDTQENG